MSQKREVSIPIMEEERSVETSSMGDSTREFLVQDDDVHLQAALVTDPESSDILNPTLASASVPIFKTFDQEGDCSEQDETQEEKNLGDMKKGMIDYDKTYVERVMEEEGKFKEGRVGESMTTMPWNVGEGQGQMGGDWKSLRMTDLFSTGSTNPGGSQSRTSSDKEKFKKLPPVKEDKQGDC